jgi:hypothetical protein
MRMGVNPGSQHAIPEHAQLFQVPKRWQIWKPQAHGETSPGLHSLQWRLLSEQATDAAKTASRITRAWIGTRVTQQPTKDIRESRSQASKYIFIVDPVAWQTSK